MSASFRWDTSPTVLANNLGSYLNRLLAAIGSLADFFAARIESFARSNAPWTDRTGDARRGLTAKVFKSAAAVTIVLFHTMSYGIWLEVKNQGRFAIILKALEAHYGQIMAAIQALMR
jgi:hypothetical protein